MDIYIIYINVDGAHSVIAPNRVTAQWLDTVINMIYIYFLRYKYISSFLVWFGLLGVNASATARAISRR